MEHDQEDECILEEIVVESSEELAPEERREAAEMLHALGPYAAGLNAARWDLKASVVNQQQRQAAEVSIPLPAEYAEDAEVGMQKAVDYVVGLIESKDPIIPW